MHRLCLHSLLPPLVQSQRPKQLSRDDVRVILFGLPEGKSIVESKAAADEVLEFLAGRPVVIKGIFHLGKYNTYPHN